VEAYFDPEASDLSIRLRNPMTEGNSWEMNFNTKAEVLEDNYFLYYFLALPQKVTKRSRAEKPSSESYASFRTLLKLNTTIFSLTFFIAKKVTKSLVIIQSRSGENQAACFASKRTKSHCIAI
jgi:hypothetical protein